MSLNQCDVIISDVTLSKHGRVMNINKYRFNQFSPCFSLHKFVSKTPAEKHCQSGFTLEHTEIDHVYL